jgi:hypothetical protein
MVLGSGKESAPSLEIKIESEKLIVNQSRDQFIEILMKIA